MIKDILYNQCSVCKLVFEQLFLFKLHRLVTIYSVFTDMAASPGAPEASPLPSPVMEAGTPPLPEEPIQNRCRLCAKDTTNWIDIFSESGKQQGLPSKVGLCLPVLVSTTFQYNVTIRAYTSQATLFVLTRTFQIV